MNEKYNSSNIRTFKEHGLMDCSAYIYNCVLCESLTSIENSISRQGHKLICNYCIKDKFNNIDEAFKWVME